MTDVTIEVHRTPPPGWTAASYNIGHVRAVGKGADVYLPCSLTLLDDPALVEHYVKTRLLVFHNAEVDRQAGR